MSDPAAGSAGARNRVEVTVVITTRNRGEFCNRAVASALAQTTEGVEVVVVDDGSDEPFRPADPGERVRV
ncbi:MAG: glycosyltransferase, partial [Actinomycetota bacterium]|nr:glycosyltransferase [Actinomycetota bacterium]